MKKLLLLPLLLFVTLCNLFAQGPGCPNINAGPDQTLGCNVTCTTLNASLFQTGATTNYTVTSIPYSPPSPTTGWTNTFVNTDDVWSGVINLPFTFCFYGGSYNQLVVGANGVISFNTGYANQYCPWSFSASVPNAVLPANAIFGAYHDMDPSKCGNIRYAISGVAPCRTFMFDFNAVCHYSCNSLKTTQRIVLYETSNAIEIYVGSKPTCGGWNGGRAVIGIQNGAGSQGLVAPGRQTGSWTATNEAWRFTPSGAPNYQVEWFSSAAPGSLGTGTTINVCPTANPTTYSAILTYTNCNGSTVKVSDEVKVFLTSPPQPPIFNNTPCPGQTLSLGTNTVSGSGVSYVWSGPGGWTATGQNPSRTNVTTTMGGTYTLYVVANGCTSASTSKTIPILGGGTAPTFTVNTPVCTGSTLNFNAPSYSGATYVWSGPGGWSASGSSPTRTNVTTAHSGNYTLYVVSNGCTSATATVPVTVKAVPATPTISSNSPVCTQGTINLSANTIAGATYYWSGPGGWNSNAEDPVISGANTSMSGTYSLYVVVNGCTSATTSINVNVNGPPVPIVNTPQEACAGSSATLLSGNYPGATYVWNGPSGWTSNVASPTISPVTTAHAGNYSLYLVQSGCTSLTASSYMNVITVPTPTVSSNSPVCQGNPINLSANTVTGATYVWSGPGGWTSNAEDPTRTPAAPAHSGNYSLYLVSEGCTSNTATTAVTVNPTPTVASVPSQTICKGAQSSQVNFTGSVSGTTFAWTNNNTATGLASSGTGNIAPFTATNNTNASIVSTVTVTPSANGCQGTATSFNITVNPIPTVNNITNQTLCNGASSTAVTPTGPVNGTTFTWTNSNTAIGLPASGTGPIPVFTATNTGTTPISGTITVTPTANGCQGTPTSFTITVNPSPTVNSIPNQTICRGDLSAAVVPSGSISGTTYSWTNSNSAIGLAASGTGNIPAFTGTNTGTTPITGTITITPTANGCQGTPTTFTITVNPRPTVNAIPTQSYCPGDSTAVISPTSPVPGTTFSWTSSNPAIGLATSGNGNIPSFTATNPGGGAISSTVTVTPTANGCTGTPTSFFITVSPAPTVNTIPNQTVCNGASTTAVNPTGSIGGSTFSWINSNPSIGLAATGNGPIPAFTAVNTGDTPVVAIITVQGTSNNCTGSGTTFTITVNPTPNVNNIANQTLCNGTSTSAVNFSGNIGTATYNWTNNNTSIGLAGSGTGNIGSFTATNNGSAPVTATITVTPTANNCAGTPSTLSITVNPTPTVAPTADQTLCNGTPTAAVNFTGSVTGTSYDWTNNDIGIGLAATGNGSIASFNAVNNGAVPATATVIVTPTANNCVGVPDTFNITVNPTPTVNDAANQTLCDGAATNAVNFTGPVSGTTYTWTNDEPSIGLAANGNGNISSFNATNSSSSPVTATITITPTANNCAGTDNSFTITVNPTPTVNNVANQTLCNGIPTTAINFGSPVNNTTYAWTNDEPSIGLAAAGNGDIPSFNAINNGTTPVTANITVTPTANNCVGVANTFTITVNPTPTVNNVADQTICNGAPSTAVHFTGSVANTTYSWVNDNPAVGLSSSGSDSIGIFNAVNNGNAPTTAMVIVTPTANGCAGLPDTLLYTVNPTPTVNNIPDQTVCNGSPTTDVNLAGPVAGTTFSWLNDNVNTGLAANGNGDILSFNGTNTTTAPITSTITITPTANNCVGVDNSFTITVNPTTTVNSISDQTLCDGEASASVSFSSPVGGTTYSWTNNDASIGLAAAGNGDIPSFNAVNNGTAPVTATITVTPTANNCVGTPNTFSITVNPTPTVNNVANQVLCNGAASTDVNFTGPVAGTTYSWTNNEPGIGLGANGNGDILVFNAVNNGTTPVTATITVTPSANNCVGVDNTFTVTVNPTPTIDSVLSQTLCNGALTSAINFSGSVNGTTYNWTNNNTNTGLSANGNGDIIAFNATNTTSSPIISTVTVTPSANNCDGVPIDFDIIVNPTHTGTPVDASICDGDTYNFGGQGFTTPGSYPVIFPNVYGCDSTVTLNLTVIPASGPPPTNTYFNTGTNGTGGVLPGGSQDAHWTVSTGNINGPYVPAIVMSTTPASYYSSPWPDCNWISHSANGHHTVDQQYFYKIEFDLACTNECGQSYTDPNVFCLNLDFFADNSVYEIYVNGVPQSAQLGNMPVPNPYYATGYNASGMVSVSFCDGWQPGTNSVIVEVVSGPDYAGFLGQTSVNPPPPLSDTTTASICDNETYTFGTQTLSAAGTYLEIFSSAMGCDSAVTLILSVNPTYTGIETAVICDDDTYMFGGQPYNTAGSYPVTFQTIHGCDSTVTLNLAVNPTYTSNIQATICQGDNYTFGGNTYNTSGSYPVTFPTINGCDSTVTLDLTVNPNPNATISPQADQCLNGNSFNFSLTTVLGPTATYNWTFNGATTGSSTLAAPQNIIYSAAGQYNVTVTVNENGCESNGTLTVNVLDQPNVQFLALPPTGCIPLTVVFTNQTTGGGTEQWTFTGGTPSSATSSPVSVVYNTPGLYGVSLTVTNANGCSDTESHPSLISVENPPTADFIIQPLEVSIANPVAQFIDASTGAANVYYFVGNNGSGTPGPDAQYHFQEEGEYDVMQVVTSSIGCTDTAYGHLVVTGNTEVFIPNSFTPNADPNNPGFGVYGNGFTDFHMMIFNRWGEMLYETHDSNQRWDGTYGGKPVPMDVYVYKVELRDYKKKLLTYIGSVTLIR